MKVSVIEPVGGHGGLEFYDLGLCEALSLNQVDVILYTCDQTKLQLEYDHHYRVIHSYKNVFGPSNKVIRGLRYILGTFRALMDSKAQRSEIAHFHLFHFSILEYFNLMVFRLFGFKIIATIHDVEPLDRVRKKSNGKKYKKFQKSIDRMIVHNRFTKSEILNISPSFNAEKIHVIPPTDLDFIYNRKVQRSRARELLDLDVPKNSKIVLFFGQIKKTKGLDILIRAFSGLGDVNLFLVIAGRAWKTDMAGYRRLISELGIEKRTKLIDKFIENRDVMLLFKACDVVVLPYLKVYNSSVLLRGMDYGAANIVSDLDFFTEIIQDGVNGLVFKKSDENDLQSVLHRVLNDPRLLERIRENAKRYIDQNYSFAISGAETKEVYRKVLE